MTKLVLDNNNWERKEMNYPVGIVAMLGLILLAGCQDQSRIQADLRARISDLEERLTKAEVNFAQAASATSQPKATPPSDNQIISARQFSVVDEQGRTRAALSAGKGGPALTLLDVNGKYRAVLGLGDDGPLLSMIGSHGELGAALFVGMLSLSDTTGAPRIKLFVDKEVPAMFLLDANGKPRFGAFSDKDGSGMGLFDANGKKTWSAP